MISPKVRLVIAGVLFLGWMGVLGYTAWSKSRGPVVSKAQATAATQPVVATLSDGPDGKPAAVVKVVESLKDGGPAAGTELYVTNMADVRGYDHPGPYLLLLGDAGRPIQPGAESPVAVVGPQRSPGYDLAGTGNPTIYRWSDDVRVQAKKLFP